MHGYLIQTKSYLQHVQLLIRTFSLNLDSIDYYQAWFHKALFGSKVSLVIIEIRIEKKGRKKS